MSHKIRTFRGKCVWGVEGGGVRIAVVTADMYAELILDKKVNDKLFKKRL